MPSQCFILTPQQAGVTLAAFLRMQTAGAVVERGASAHCRAARARRRRVMPRPRTQAPRRGDDRTPRSPRPKIAKPEAVVVRHLDEHLVVVEKPAGMSTVRHPAERHWSERRKVLHPTLQDIVPRLILKAEGRKRKGGLPALRAVHRLDKETSGLVVFARTPLAQRGLGKQFHAHTVLRRYLAIVPGDVPSQRIATRLVRDRGDGRRGSTHLPGQGKEAVTHVEVVERLPGHTLLACRLETGRTHQIRIHLAERGHPVCGEKVYRRPIGGDPIPDRSGAPRLALHAAELGFLHPATGEKMFWTMPLPTDLERFLATLRKGSLPC